MNKLLNSFLIISLSIVTSSTLSGACTLTGTDGGKCIEYSDGTTTINFVEETVNQFEFEFNYLEYQKLIGEYKKDSTNNAGKYDGFKIAGLGFIPIISPIVTPPPPTGVTKYVTSGIRVVLVLWEGMVVGGQNAPNKVELFGYTNLGDAFSFQVTPIPPSQASFVHDLTNPVANSQVQLVNHPLVSATREFEIVFLSLADFEYLATSENFYSTPRSDMGITVERAFNTIEPNQGVSGMTHYRTLLFKPFPDPGSTQYPSEASVAYRNGEYCPPYWVDPTGDQFCANTKSECFLVSMIKKQPVITTDTIYIREQGEGSDEPVIVDKIRWDWMVAIIAAFLLIFFGGRTLLSNRD